MNEIKETRHKWLHLRLTNNEYELLQKQFKGTTERKISAYARKVFLGKPMIAGHRNLSMDKLINEFSALLKDLNGIANNYNQAVHKLHTLNTEAEAFKWIIAYKNEQSRMMESVEEIREIIRKTSSRWLQS